MIDQKLIPFCVCLANSNGFFFLNPIQNRAPFILQILSLKENVDVVMKRSVILTISRMLENLGAVIRALVQRKTIMIYLVIKTEMSPVRDKRLA